MGENSNIQWTDCTWNPWQGCQKVSPGCKFCYMYRDKKRYGQDPATVVRSSDQTFYAPLKKFRDGSKVFTCSWSDFFIEAADSWRPEAWDIIKNTPHLTYQILTKRPENILDRLPADWGDGYANVWLGISAENQAYLDRRMVELRKVPAKIKFLSCEPILSHIDLTPWLGLVKSPHGQIWSKWHPDIHWVIIGGESGPEARPFNLFWAIEIIRQCQEAGVPVFMKQIGKHPYAGEDHSGEKYWLILPGDAKGGDMALWPEIIRVREFPK